MNEILKKRIKEAAINGSKHYDPDVSKYSQGKQVGYLRGFAEGAEYALQNQWISVEEALPGLDEEVLAMSPDGSHAVVCRKERLTTTGRVVEWRNGDYTYDDAWINYWMPIPEYGKEAAL